jgi:hypothetical protein
MPFLLLLQSRKSFKFLFTVFRTLFSKCKEKYILYGYCSISDNNKYINGMLGFFLATENVSRRVVTLWNKISKFSDTLKWMEKVYQKMDNLPAPIAHIIYLF